MIFRRLIIAALLALTIPGRSFAQNKQIPDVTIHCKDPKIRSDALDFFQSNLRPGIPKRDLSNLIKRYYFQWPIKDIQVKQDGAVFVIDIELKSMIMEFDVEGNKGVRDLELIRELKDAQTLYQGDNMTEELAKRAKEYYTYRGYPNAEIELQTLPRREAGTIEVVLKVKENKPCMVEEVDLMGGSSTYWKNRITEEFKYQKHMRCDQERLQAHITRMRNDYNDDYYYQFDIKNATFTEIGGDKLRTRLTADLVVGPRIIVEFRGNQFAFERSELLRRAIFLDQERKFNASFENSSIQSLRDFYDSRGYPFAQIGFKRLTEVGKTRLIFTIDRGPIIRINQIRFDGNREIKDRDLEKQFWNLAPEWTRKKLYVSGDISTITNGLLAYYQSMGYLHAVFFEPVVDIKKDKHQANISFKLQEGEPSFFDEFLIKNNVFMSTEEIQKFFDVKKDDPIDPVAMRDAAQKLEYAYQTKGFKYAKVYLPEVDSITEGYNQYIINIDEGPRVTFGDIIIRGNYATHEYVIAREVSFKPGDTYSPESLNNTRSKLLRKGFFRSVTLEEKPRDDLQNVEDVIITVVEAKKRSLIIRPGVSTDEGARLTSTLGYSNIAGTGRNAIMTGRINHRLDSDAIMEHRVIFSYLEPRVVGTFDGKLNLINEQREEDQFNISSSSIILGIENTSMLHFRPTLQWQLEFRNPFDVLTGANLNPLLDNTRARFGALAGILDFDYRDNLLNATKGTFHRVQLTYYDKFLLSEAQFWQAYVRNNFYMPIYHRIRTVLSVRAGVSGTFGKTKDAGIEEIPIEKRFRLGGNSSLRGFGLNCVGGLPANDPENCSNIAAPGGNSMVNYLLDFLLPLSPSVDFVLFTDGGNAFLNNEDFDIWRIRTTAGFGLRYNTVVGPLRVDYGVKLDRRTGESFGEFHFAVGQF